MLISTKEDVLAVSKAFDEFVEKDLSEELTAIIFLGFSVCFSQYNYNGIELTELILKFQKFQQQLEDKK